MKNKPSNNDKFALDCKKGIVKDCDLKGFILTYLQELRGPPTMTGVEEENVTIANWRWYGAMDAALRRQHSHSRPQLVVANAKAAAHAMFTTPAFGPSLEGRGRKRAIDDSESIFNFLKEQAEREEKWQRETLRREEEKEKAESERTERFLTLFEKLVNKF